jgi:hypothetical protein
MKKYYYSDATGQSVGPLSYDELALLFESGQIKPETYVAEEGDDKWKPFSSISKSQTTSASDQPVSSTPMANPKIVMSRYSSAFTVARDTVTAGLCIKVFAVILGLIISLGGGFGTTQYFPPHGNDSLSLLAEILGPIILAFIVSLPLYILGILVKAQGQFLLATLDGVVQSSPFLNDEQKVTVLRIK